MMNSLKLASVGIHGLRNSTKRKTFFRYLKEGAFDIICIQESYITDADKEMWEKESVCVCGGGGGGVIVLYKCNWTQHGKKHFGSEKHSG